MISAVISDLDGTLLETEEVKALSHARAVRELRPDVPQSAVTDLYADELVGRSRREVTTRVIGHFVLEDALKRRMERDGATGEPWEYLVEIRHEIYEEMLKDPGLIASKRYPHNIELLRELKSEGYTLALATMSYLHQVERVLEVLEVEDLFDVLVTADDISRGKPDPEIDLLAAKRLGVAPEEVVVLEDSAAGIGAAINAGMSVVGVPTEITNKSVQAANLLEPRWIVTDASKLSEVFHQRIAEAGGGAPEKAGR